MIYAVDLFSAQHHYPFSNEFCAIFTHISSSTKLRSKNRPITLITIAATCYLLFPAYGLSALLSCPQNNCEISEGWAVYFFPLKYHASDLAAQVVVYVCEIMSL